MQRQKVNVDLKNDQMSRFFQKGPIRRESARTEKNKSMPSPRDVISDKKEKVVVKIFDRVIGLSIFMLFLGVPLYFTGLTTQGLVFEKQLYFYFWLLLGLVAWAAKGVTFGEMKIKRTSLDWPIAGFWFIYLIATIFSVDKWHSFWGAFSDPSRGLMSITAYIIAFYFVLSNFSAKRLKMVLIAMISSGIVLAIWTLLAILGINFLPDNIAAYSPLSLIGSISGLGIMFSALIPLGIVAILKISEKDDIGKTQKNILLYGLSLFLLIDLFLILALYNYIPWISLFIGIGIFLIFILAKIVRPNSSWVWLPLVIFVLIMIFKMIGDIPITQVDIPVEVSLNSETSSQIATESLKEKFLVGSGPATYGYDFSMNKPEDFNLNAFYNLRFYQGSGMLAELVPTVGFFGTIFFLILVLTYIGSQIYFLYREKERNKLYSLGFFSATLILLVSSLFMRVNGTILAMTVLLATASLAVSFLESETKENDLNLSLKASPKFALALAFVFMVISAGVAFLFVYLGKVYAADIYSGKAAVDFANNQEKAISYLGKSINYNNREAKYYIQVGQYYMAMANQEAGREENSRSTEKISDYLNSSITAARIAKDISKNDVSIIESLALIYENASLYVADSLSLAEDNYKRALELEPNNPIYYAKLGQIKISMASAKESVEEKKKLANEAKELFQKAIEKKSNYADGYYQLALIYEALEEFDEAVDNANKAVNIKPQEPNYLLALGRIYGQRDKDGDFEKAENYYKKVIALNNDNISGHFYLGLLYENNSKNNEAKAEYNKVISILEKESKEQNKEALQKTISQLEKMVDNINRGIKNTPESLGLIQEAQAAQEEADQNKDESEAPSIEENTMENPTIDETQTETTEEGPQEESQQTESSQN